MRAPRAMGQTAPVSRPEPDPRLVVALAGLPGAGKSVVARRLARACGFRLIDRDRVRAAMFPDCRFDEKEKRAANSAVLAAVRANCALGLSSVVDGWALSRAADRDALRGAAAERGFRFALLLLDCPVEVAARRVAADRSHSASDRTPGLVREVASRFDPPPADAIAIDATGEPDAVFAAALRALRAAEP